MAVSAIQTVLCWTVAGELAIVEFFRAEDHYVFAATPKTLRKSLLLIGQCARNPDLSLTWDDAAQVTKALRQLVVVPEPVMPTVGDATGLGWVFVFGCGFWVWVISKLV
jgi:hypothetical protein